MMMYLKLAWRNIWRNKKRTWITASSIAFAVFFASVMQSMQLGSYERMIENSVRFQTGHIGVHEVSYWDEQILDNSFDQAAITDDLLRHDHVELIVPRLSSFALAAYEDRTKGVMVNGIDLERESKLTMIDKKVVAGALGVSGGAMVAEGLADYLKVGIGDTIVLISSGYRGVNAAGKYPVAAILKFPVPEMNKGMVYLELEEAQYFFGAEGRLTTFSLLIDDPANTEIVKSAIVANMSSYQMDVMTWREMLPELLQSIELDYYGGLIMIYILYAVIGFGIFGTFIMMAKERTYEFGILVSIGMKKVKIMWMVFIELLMLTFFGVLLGLMISSPLIIYMFNNPIRVTGEMAAAYEKFGMEPILPFSMDPTVFYSQGFVIFIITLLLSIYPMLAIGQLKIIKALKE
ncbi:MAG: ABC transporter permease [Cyclobacteriaceae bacterium]